MLPYISSRLATIIAAEDKITLPFNPVSENGSGNLIISIINTLLLITVIATVVIIVINGAKFVFSQGDPKSVESAKKGLTNAVIGLGITVSARVIMIFITNAITK